MALSLPQYILLVTSHLILLPLHTQFHPLLSGDNLKLHPGSPGHAFFSSRARFRSCVLVTSELRGGELSACPPDTQRTELK